MVLQQGPSSHQMTDAPHDTVLMFDRKPRVTGLSRKGKICLGVFAAVAIVAVVGGVAGWAANRNKSSSPTLAMGSGLTTAYCDSLPASDAEYCKVYVSASKSAKFGAATQWSKMAHPSCKLQAHPVAVTTAMLCLVVHTSCCISGDARVPCCIYYPVFLWTWIAML